MFTLVTKKTFQKATISYLGVAIFLGVFAYVYEQFSFGESSLYMRFVFVVPLLAGLVTWLSSMTRLWMSNRLSLRLFNAMIATLISGCLIKGIVDISGRSTTLELSYWYVSLVLFAMSIASGSIVRKRV